MIDFENVRKRIAKGLSDYLSCKVIRGNQTAPMPAFPYCTYNITALASENKGSYGVYEDDTARKPYVLTLSFTSHSNDYAEAVKLANMAHSWLDYVGTTELNDNDVIVQSVGNITDRSNLLSMEYEYTYGFDCFLWVYDEIAIDPDKDGYIESITINEQKITAVDLNERLKNRLDGID